LVSTTSQGERIVLSFTWAVACTSRATALFLFENLFYNVLMQDCIFCKIIKKESPANIVFKDDVCFVFSPLDPITKGHVLIVPKVHSKNIFDIDANVLAQLITITQKVAHDIVDKNKATGVNLLHASGKDAQQSIFHFHFHLVPRYPDDGLDLWLKNKL